MRAMMRRFNTGVFVLALRAPKIFLGSTPSLPIPKRRRAEAAWASTALARAAKIIPSVRATEKAVLYLFCNKIEGGVRLEAE
jgi:hypothetical protein